jgi:hypothetical protein
MAETVEKRKEDRGISDENLIRRLRLAGQWCLLSIFEKSWDFKKKNHGGHRVSLSFCQNQVFLLYPLCNSVPSVVKFFQIMLIRAENRGA